MTTIPCFLCGDNIKQKIDKNNKPYFICDPCGVQMFIRRKQGITNLAELLKNLSLHAFQFHEHTYVLCEIQAVLAEIRGIKKEIKSIERGFDFLMSEKDQEDRDRTLELLNKRIENQLDALERIAGRNK